MKNTKTLNDIVTQIAKSHLGIQDLSAMRDHQLPLALVKIALTEAVKAGEKGGYNKGYADAKEGCGNPVCECEHNMV